MLNRILTGPSAFGIALALLALPTLPTLAQERAALRESRDPNTVCSWDTGFHIRGFNGSVNAILEFDDGSGSAVYAAGDFTAFEDQPLPRVAKWNGSAWSPVGVGFDAAVLTLEVYDDGTGPALYAGGAFKRSGRMATPYIAMWDGHAWRPLADGAHWQVVDLQVHDDGSGPALYAAGSFDLPGSSDEVSSLARWNGRSWVFLSPPGSVFSMASFDAGDGPRLFVGGSFSLGTDDPYPDIPYASKLESHGLLVWDGSTWQVPGDGVDPQIWSLGVFDLGSGPALYIGTRLTGSAAQGVLRWDGSSYEILGTRDYRGTIWTLAAFDDGSGPALYAAGNMVQDSGGLAAGILRWDGASWQLAGGGVDEWVRTLWVREEAQGSVLYVGGTFTNVGAWSPSGPIPWLSRGVVSSGLARWNGVDWSTPPGTTGQGQGLDDWVESLAVYDDGSGPALVASGFFNDAGGEPVEFIARWDGEAWQALGDGLGYSASALAVFDAGSGPQLIAAGWFTEAGGAEASYIAAWDGSAWQPLGTGLDDVAQRLAVYDDGTGNALYAAGRFRRAGGVEADRVARWDGQAWSALGNGPGGDVYDLVVWNDGDGPALYALGAFGTVEDPVGLLQWDSTVWRQVDQSRPPGDVSSVHVLDDTALFGTYAPSLYVTLNDSQGSATVARWDGTGWQVLEGLEGVVFALEIVDAAGGPTLYAAGLLYENGDQAGGLAYWNGKEWRRERFAAVETVRTLLQHDDGSGPALFAGGHFRNADGTFSSRIGKYSCEADPVVDFTGSCR